MIIYNDENCEKVARYVAEQMDIECLIEFVTEELYDRYSKDEEVFRAEIEISSIEESDLCDLI